MGESKLKIKVVAKGKRAKDLAQTLAGMPDSSGANFVSRNDLHVAPGAASGVCHAAERVSHKEVPDAGVKGGANSDRRALNLQRDQRTKLGRGKPAVVEVE